MRPLVSVHMPPMNSTFLAHWLRREDELCGFQGVQSNVPFTSDTVVTSLFLPDTVQL
jgi:hypothetical protein